MLSRNAALIVLAVCATCAVGCDKKSEMAPEMAANEKTMPTGGAVMEVEEAVEAEPSSVAPAEMKEEVAAPKRMMAMKGKPVPSPSMAIPTLDSDEAGEPDPTSQGSEDYKDHGFNPWTNTADDSLSTFSVDVDTGSYTITRRKLMQDKVLPPPASVRVEEFVNYFKYDYPNPDGTFGVYLEAAPSPFATKPHRYLVRVGVQGKRVAAKERKPIHLTLLVDTSGSMNQQEKLPLAVEALKVLVNNLQPKDTVALVTYAGYVSVPLQPTGAENRGAIFEALDSLGAGGGTGMSSGMELAYKMAIKQKKGGSESRVIVMSDGDANIGNTSHDEILKQIQDYVSEGVTLSTIGFGMGNYKDTMMEQLANKGNGNYYYIDNIQEARKVFGEQLDGTLQVIAKDVKLQVEFDPETVPRYRLIGYENRDIADRDFRNDKVDAGEIGAGHTVTALYEIELAAAPKGKVAVVRVRHKLPDGFKATEDEFPLTDTHFKSKLGEASNDFQFAASVATFAELLRKSPHVAEVNYAWVKEIASGAAAPGQADRQEFLKLVDAASRL